LLQAKKLTILAIKLGLIGLILWYLVHSDKLNLETMGLFWKRPALMFGLTLLVLGATNLIVCYRWNILLKAQGETLPMARLYMIHWISQFFATVLPGTVSTDGVKAFYAIKETEGRLSKTECLTVLVVDRILGFYGLILVSVFALLSNLELIFSNPKLHLLALFVFGLTLGMSLFFAVIIFPFDQERDPFLRIAHKLPGSGIFARIYLAFKHYQHHLKTLALGLFLSVIGQLSVVIFFVFLTPLVCNCVPPTWNLMFAVPLGELSTVVPLGPAGIGVGHVAFDFLFGQMGMPAGADAFNLFTVIRLAVGLFGGIPYLMFKKRDGAFKADPA